MTRLRTDPSPVYTLSTPRVAAPRRPLAVLPPLALYVHIPWCVRKCPYCDFNSHELRGALPEAAYVAALTADLEAALPNVWGRRVHSIFFGGGTPSLFSAASIDAILAMVRARLTVDPQAEITVEANPGASERQKFRDLRAAGVNRLSIGIQSFDARHLRALGRIHDADDAGRALDGALEAFDDVNVDLMYGLPGQTVAEALADVERALASGVTHLSAYHLTIEPNTLFHRHPPPLPDDDAVADMEAALQARLAAAGYERYEISAYAQPGRRCRHNLNYWTYGDYLGIGAGAHSKLSLPERIIRESRHRQPKQYIESALAGDARATSADVADDELGFEFMMNALRLTGGVPAALFEQRTGLPLLRLRRALVAAEARGLLERDHRMLRPSALGQRFLNDLLQSFLER